MAFANKDSYSKWYMANRERLIAKARAAELANPEKAAQRKREYAARNPDKVKDAARRYSQKPEAQAKLRERRSKEGHKAKAKQLREHYRDTLHDCFVRRCLAQNMKIKGSEIPQTLVDAHRELMKLKRMINEKL